MWGNCTWYVASYKNVNWRGNANQWLKNAAKAGHATGTNPSIGAIIQFE
jgi:surface antigen